MNESQVTAILLDNSVLRDRDLGEWCFHENEVQWGPHKWASQIQGFRRKCPPIANRQKDLAHQSEIDALFTIGRLIREGRIKAYEYTEIKFENIRGGSQNIYTPMDAFRDSEISDCQPAINRGKLCSGHFSDVVIKGTQKQHDAGKNITLGQIAFFRLLLSLNESMVDQLASISTFGLSPFDVESLQQLDFFRSLCEDITENNYPDMFHLWTASRNGFSYLLTLDKQLIRKIRAKRNSLSVKFHLSQPILPKDLLKQIGIDQPDQVPFEFDRFYETH